MAHAYEGHETKEEEEMETKAPHEHGKHHEEHEKHHKGHEKKGKHHKGHHGFMKGK